MFHRIERFFIVLDALFLAAPGKKTGSFDFAICSFLLLLFWCSSLSFFFLLFLCVLFFALASCLEPNTAYDILSLRRFYVYAGVFFFACFFSLFFVALLLYALRFFF